MLRFKGLLKHIICFLARKHSPEGMLSAVGALAA